MSATFADYCKTLTAADLRDLGVHPGCVGTVLEMLASDGPAANEGDGGVRVAGWLRDALMLRWVTQRIHAQASELDEARALVARLVRAMKEWGSWEDGVPDANCGGDVGAAFDAAVAYLDAVKPAAGGSS